MSYIAEIADQIRREVSPDLLPEGDTDLLFLIYAVLALATGEHTTSEHVHDAWAAWMTCVDPSHESIKPFDELDPATRREDGPFVDAIRTVAARLG